MNKKSVVGNYDEIAKKYAIDVEDKPIHLYYVRPAMLSLLPQNLEGKRVLDAGCGSGWYSDYFLKNKCDVTAVDSNQYLVDYTQKRTENRIKTGCFDLNKALPFPDESFDLIFAALVIHYIDDWRKLFSEFSRLLKIGGEIALSLPQPQMTAVLFRLSNYYTKTVIEDHWDGVGKVNFYHHTLNELFECILESGLYLKVFKELLPLEQLRTADPKMYENTSTKPWFLFISLVKNG